MNRRDFVKALSAAALLPGLETPLLALASGADSSPLGRFDPIAPSDADDLILPSGFRYDVVLKWGDPFTASGEPFGYNNDWIGVFPLKDDEEALLAVNHEYISLAFLGDAALYPATFQTLRGRAPTVEDYKRDVGVPRPCVHNIQTGAFGDHHCNPSPVFRDYVGACFVLLSACLCVSVDAKFANQRLSLSV
jgi:secreted PhoX family phosphatase